MKAAFYTRAGAPSVIEFGDRPDPIPGDEEVLVRVEAVSIEGGDLLSRQGIDPGGTPYVGGYAAAGEIVASGSRVTGFTPGQKVTTFAFGGSHASLRAVPAATCFAVPTGMDITVAAAALIGTGTAALALSQGGIARGETVLVTGAAGGVGVATVQLAHLAGARVIGTGSSPTTLEALRGYGLDVPLVVGTVPIKEQLAASVGDRGVDLVIDNVGAGALQDALTVTKDGARIVLVGVLGDGDRLIDSFQILFHRLTVIGCFLGPIMARPDVRRLVEDALQQVAAGEIEVPIDAVFPLSDAVAAHTRAQERGRLGRVVMVP
jgi:NADPH:quinone reductase-like Zn-dependent oxidoreductase